MIGLPAALVLLLTQGAPLEAERERIRARVPLTEPERAAFQSPPAAEPKPARGSLTVALVPLEFADRPLEADNDLSKSLLEPVGAYYREVSGARLAVSGRLWPALRVGVDRAAFKRADLQGALDRFLAREGPAVLATADAVVFAAAGPLAPRGTLLWPHKGALEFDRRAVEYVLVPAEPGPRSVAAAVHEFMHLLGFEDKYDDEKSSVGADCILGTGFDPKRLPPPCADCRLKLGWAAAAPLDPARMSNVVLGRSISEIVRIPLVPDGSEALILELRDRLLIWHAGGGKRIELLGRFPSDTSDRLTPLSEPAFRGRNLGACKVWISDIRIEDGRAWFRVGPDAPLTALEEWRRTRVGKRLGD